MATYQVPVAQQQDFPIKPSEALREGGQEVITGPEGGIRDLRHHRVRTDDLSNGHAGILSTALSSFGSPVSNLTDDCLVTFQGQQMTLEVAARIGLVRKDAQGNYTDLSSPEKKQDDGQVDGQPEEQRQEGPECLDAETEAVIEDIYQTIGKESADSAVTQWIYTDDVTQLMKDKGAQLGLEPVQALEQATMIHDKFAEQAAKYISRKHGLDGKAVLDWAEQNMTPEIIRPIVMRHVFRADLSAYDELAKAYPRG